jgi:hydrogenase maturation protease
MNEWEWQLLEDKTLFEAVRVREGEVRARDRVRLLPKSGGDVLDLALAGKAATVESIEQDYEGNLHISVVVDDDPGSDLGLFHQPGHRFFFRPDELVALPASQPGVNVAARILVAGIGNIFLGDDAFGLEVVRRLSGQQLPAGVRAVDFGIRGFDLACALLEGPDTTILVDVCARGDPPGTLYLLELDVESDEFAPQAGAVETHAMNPVNVLRLARSMGNTIKRVVLVGCEPASFGPDEGHMGLSSQVRAAIEPAMELVESLVVKILAGEPLAPGLQVKNNKENCHGDNRDGTQQFGLQPNE